MRQIGSEYVVTVSRFFSEMGSDGLRVYLITQVFLMAIMVFLTIRSGAKSLKSTEQLDTTRFRTSDYVFGAILFLFVMMGRFPNAIYGYYNPDEGLWIACTKVLLQDPRPWVSVDMSTSGPLVLIPLLILKILGLPLDFGSLKIASGFTVATTLFFTYLTYRKLFEVTIARLSILLVAVVLSLTSHLDLIAYNGEQMPLLFLSIALLLLSDSFTSHSQKLKNFILAGVFLGMLPFSKLQSAPMGVLVAIGAIILLIYRKYPRKHIFYFVLAGLLPTGLVILWLSVMGGLSHFWNSFIMFNLFYSVSGAEEPVFLFEKLRLAWNLIFSADDAVFYFQASTCIGLFCLLFTNYAKLWKQKKQLYILIFTFLFFITSLFCIGQPYRWFFHYVQFAFLPASLLTTSLLSVALSTNDSTRHQFVILFLSTLFICLLTFYHLLDFHPRYQQLAEVRKDGYANLPEVIKALNKYTKPGDRIVTWGWCNTFYSDTDLIMGTRYADTYGILRKTRYTEFFQNILLSDMEKNKPEIFLDANSPKAEFFASRWDYGFHHFPAIANYIKKNYKQMGEVDGFRIYVRK